MRMGIPKVITSDQGSEFNNKLNDAFMERLQIDHRLTTPYHPQVSKPICIHTYSTILLIIIFQYFIYNCLGQRLSGAV